MCLDPRGPTPPSYGQFISLHVEKAELNIKYRYRSDHMQLLKMQVVFHIGRVNSYTFFVIPKAI